MLWQNNSDHVLPAQLYKYTQSLQLSRAARVNALRLHCTPVLLPSPLLRDSSSRHGCAQSSSWLPEKWVCFCLCSNLLWSKAPNGHSKSSPSISNANVIEREV